MKLKRKALSILLTLSLLVTMLVPLASPALAANEYSSLKAPTVEDDGVRELGTVFAHLTAGSLTQGDTVTLRLPSDFIWLQEGSSTAAMTDAMWSGSVSGNAYRYGTVSNYVEVPEQYSGDNNGLSGGGMLEFDMISDKEVKMTVTGVPSSGDDIYFYLYAKRVWVDGGYDGEINVTFDAQTGSGFPGGSAIIGTVSGSGLVSASVDSVDSFSDSDQIALRFTEDREGALEDGDDSIKLKLPSGFVFSSVDGASIIWGGKYRVNGVDKPDLDSAAVLACIHGAGTDELTLDFPNGFETTEAVSVEVKTTISVDDETDAKTGDVVARVSGNSNLNISEGVVGKYGNYDTKIECQDAPTIYAGMTEQKIGNITISESVAESLVDGRTLTLELPANAKWGDLDDDSDKSLDIDITSFPGTDGKTAKFTFNGNSSDAATLTLEDMEVVLEPGVTGDLVVKAGGTAGLSGELTVAKIVSPVKAEAASAPEVKIGSVFEAGDVTITEVAAGAIKDNEWLILDLPQGVRFVSAPKVEVTEGDLKIDEDSVKTQKDGEEDDNQVAVYIDSESATASKIKVSGMKYIVDRTVPEGDIAFKVKGDAVIEVNNPDEVEDYYGTITSGVVKVDGIHAFDVETSGSDAKKVFPKSTTAAKTVSAKVVTPASGGYTGTAAFVIGQTTYKMNEKEMTMDVAPYIKGDRTFLPVRYVANALGVADSNIMWNDADQSVIIIKGERVIKMVIGSNEMLINGTSFTMDVAPEIVDPGRTMLPLRFVAQALGADVQWDEATQTATVVSK